MKTNTLPNRRARVVSALGVVTVACLAAACAPQPADRTTQPTEAPATTATAETAVRATTPASVPTAPATDPAVNSTANPASDPAATTGSAPAAQPVTMPAVDLQASVSVAPPQPQPTTLAFEAAAGIGGLTSNASGCASRCIAAASLTIDPFNQTATLQMSTNVSARMGLWISTQPITTDSLGQPVFANEAEVTVGKARLSKDWTQVVTTLQPSTTYRAIIRARDVNGNRDYATATFTTPAGAPSDALVAPGGCAVGCITVGTVQAGPRYPSANLVIETSTPATLQVFVSTSQPGTIGGAPVLPADRPVTVAPGLRTSWVVVVGELAGDTDYHVVVRAEDTNGGVSHRVGMFRSGPRPPDQVTIAIESIYVSNDGDRHGDGYMNIIYGVHERPVVGEPLDFSMSESVRTSLGDQQSWIPPSPNEWTITLPEGAELPWFGATIWEADYSSQVCTGGGVIWVSEPTYIDPCNDRATAALATGVTLADVATWQPCSAYGVIGAHEDEPCILLTASGPTEQYVSFAVVVRVHVA